MADLPGRHRSDDRGRVLTHRAVDAVFGPVDIELDRDVGRVVILADQLPPVTIQRSLETELLRYVPIGTRDRTALRMLVGGREQHLEPEKPGLSRRSYRVAAQVDGADLLLTPNTPGTSRLVRGTSYRGDNELGSFERQSDGSVRASWSGEVTALGVTVQALRPEPVEAAVGYALAAAFGTGAYFFLGALLARMAGEHPG